MNKQALPKQMQGLYDGVKSIMTPEAFEVWYNNALNYGKIDPQPLPTEPIKPAKPNMSEAIATAREAVSGYAPNNGARKAVEALADALEQTQ